MYYPSLWEAPRVHQIHGGIYYIEVVRMRNFTPNWNW